MTSLLQPPAVATPAAAPRTPARPRDTLLRRRTFDAAVIALAIVVILLVVYPLGKLFHESGAPWNALPKLVAEDWFPGMLRDTVLIVGGSAFISVVIGAALGWINERTDAGLGAVGDALPLVPLFLPAVALSVGWLALATPKIGLLAWLLDPIGFNIHSVPGMILTYVLLTVPYTYLPIVAAMRSVDPALEEAARTSGSGTFRVLRTISLPVVGPAILSGFILAVIIDASVYSVPMIIGQNTGLDILSVRIVHSMRDTYPIDYGAAVRLSTLLFSVLIVLYFIQRILVSGKRYARMGGQATKIARVPLGAWRWPARFVSFAYIGLSAVLPTLGILYLSLQKYWQGNILDAKWTLQNFTSIFHGQRNAMTAFGNTLALGFGCAIAIVLVTTLILTYGRQTNNWVAKVANGTARLPTILPHSVLAVSFIFAIGGRPFYLAGTLAIMAIAFFVSFLPLAIISLEAVSSQLDGSLEHAARLCGASPGRTFFQIVLPLLRPGLLATFSLVFVRVVSDLEIVVLLGTQRTPTVSWVLFDTWSTGLYTQTAAVALVMGLISGGVVMVALWLSRPAWVRGIRRAQRKKSA